MTALPLFSLLDDAGLNRRHVFDLAALPAAVRAPLALAPHERQLILFGNAGRRLWAQVLASGASTADPIDDHSVRSVQRWLVAALPGTRARFVYPSGLPEGQHLGLQALGRLAGWHHDSPFMVGVDATWGSWFAYRAVIVTDTWLPVTGVQDLGHPCPPCVERSCVTACAGRAIGAGPMDLNACLDQRVKRGSPCAQGCPAREACPVGAEHRYEQSQIAHGARVSLDAIRRHRPSPPR